jgi:hypothetical protein
MAIIFSERPYLTYSELKARWQCSDNDMSYQLITGDLKPVVKLTEALKVPDWEFGNDRSYPCGVYIDYRDLEPKEITREVSCWLYLQIPKQTGPLDCLFELASDLRNPAKPEDIFDVLNSSWLWLPESMTIQQVRDRAVFLMLEVLHFESLHDESPATPKDCLTLEKRERDTLLTIIAALVTELKILDFSPKNTARFSNLYPGKAALSLENMTIQIGARVSKRTIEEKLKLIPSAFEVRLK